MKHKSPRPKTNDMAFMFEHAARKCRTECSNVSVLVSAEQDLGNGCGTAETRQVRLGLWGYNTTVVEAKAHREVHGSRQTAETTYSSCKASRNGVALVDIRVARIVVDERGGQRDGRGSLMGVRP